MAENSGPSHDVAQPEEVLILETPNPLDLSIEDLEELVVDVERIMATNGLNDVSVRSRGNEPLGVGNQLTDYLFMFLPNAEFMKEAAFTAVASAATVFMRKRFKRKHESRRVRQIDIYGPDRELLISYRITSEDAEPETHDPGED